MALFKISGLTVKRIISKDLDLEKNLQSLFEQNLGEILNIVFLAHEYSTSFGGRIDTLGVDRNGSPCIIEYKKNQNDNVINQGLSYLRWLLDHKANFEILCQNKKIDIEIDWDSPRVICVAESYSKFDLDTADILPINVELLRYRIYDENILYLEPENYQKVKISTSGVIKKGEVQKLKDAQLQKAYSINDHLSGINKETIELFQDLRERILSLDQNIIEEAKAKYIAYKTSTNFVDIVVKQYGLKIFLNVKSGQLNDPQKLARDLTRPKLIGHWGNGDYEVKIENESNIDSVFALIKQSYDLNK
ncbi:MAG: transporter [Candidatus Portnoybacteria bacterium RBG_13_40_8]|uniref:Transporter n=1 Tax=Candidatus Portnoybacteria bacterium RBG_13_40_8 TaxID=1801990 RepID=A0A1G2F1J7_9BACT|nr:MAG: transporter [Candidatus Portnoybacteria bacterium RBG_13_40_8]OGZ35029.1 MAG: transporter [Candidatus Portnoybacteria bacterium RIFCSPHIGHO2_01_FULL_39_19]